MMNFEKVFVKLKEKGITTYKIRQDSIISQHALQALKHNRSVTTDTIEKLCKVLQCQPGDLMEYIDDEETEQIDTPTE